MIIAFTKDFFLRGGSVNTNERLLSHSNGSTAGGGEGLSVKFFLKWHRTIIMSPPTLRSAGAYCTSNGSGLSRCHKPRPVRGAVRGLRLFPRGKQVASQERCEATGERRLLRQRVARKPDRRPHYPSMRCGRGKRPMCVASNKNNSRETSPFFRSFLEEDSLERRGKFTPTKSATITQKHHDRSQAKAETTTPADRETTISPVTSPSPQTANKKGGTTTRK